MSRWLENETKLTGIFAGISILSLVLSITGLLKNVLPIDVAWIAIVLCGVPILVGAFRGLVFEHDIKADVLVALALIASVATREYFAAGEVALIMQIGSLLEDYTSGKAREGIEKLIRLKPRTAHVLRGGQETELPADEIRRGDLIRVFAGETIPVDGVITEGSTAIDQSVMTGESIPVDKTVGDPVSSGTVNQYGVFLMTAEKESEDSTLQRMIRLAQEAEENKAPVVTLADRWATWLVAAAFACAVGAWLFTGEFMRAVTVLVVFCPCAFILATPTAVLAGIGNAARYGIIVRSGDALERLSRVRRAAFDKTGTVTEGRPRVAELRPLAEGIGEKEVLRLAALAEQSSEHPLGKAIVEAYLARGGKLAAPESFQAAAGRGVAAVADGAEIKVGKRDYMLASGVFPVPENGEADGGTEVFVARDGLLMGSVVLRDTVRPDAAAVMAKLKEAGIRPMLLTGDNAAAAARAAREADIDEVHADLLPEDKLAVIKSFAGGGEPVCMIGDGVNDALALAAADAGIAMGGIGSDIAIESADAVLVSDDIRRLPYLFSLMRKVMKKVKVNIAASLVINLTAVVLSALGVLTPVTGALWHNFGSVFVVVNAALLLRERDTQTA